jgi:hypothetical protein
LGGGVGLNSFLHEDEDRVFQKMGNGNRIFNTKETKVGNEGAVDLGHGLGARICPETSGIPSISHRFASGRITRATPPASFGS